MTPKNDDLQVSFESRLKLKFLGSQITSDAGLLAYRELDETLGLTEMAPAALEDSRLGSNKQHQLVPLLRQSIYSRLAGYEDVNDAERLAIDPAMRHVVGGRAALADKYAASTSEVGRFECFYSIKMATWNERCCDAAITPARSSGVACSCR